MWQDIHLQMPRGGNTGLGVFDCHKCRSYLPHRMLFTSEYLWAYFNAPHVAIICAVRCKHQILFQQDNDPKHTTKSMEKVHWTSSVVSQWWLISLHSLQILNGKPMAGAVNVTLPFLVPIPKQRLAFCSS